MKKVKFLALMCCAAFTFAACDNNDCEDCNPKQETEETTFVGTMDVEQSDKTIFSQENISVNYTKTENDGMTLNFKQVKFAPNMPVSLDMEVKNIEYKEEDGVVVFSGNNIVPIAMGGEFPKYTITDLTGTISSGTINLSMICGVNPITYSGEISKQ